MDAKDCIAGNSLQEEMLETIPFCFQMKYLQYWLLYPQQKIHWRKIDPTMYASFNFCLCVQAYKFAKFKIRNKFPLHST